MATGDQRSKIGQSLEQDTQSQISIISTCNWAELMS